MHFHNVKVTDFELTFRRLIIAVAINVHHTDVFKFSVHKSLPNYPHDYKLQRIPYEGP